MIRRITSFKPSNVLSALLLCAAGMSTALAGQVTLSYVDANSQAQTLTLDCSSSAAELAQAAALLGEFGVHLSHDPDSGCGTLTELAVALATAAPEFAADIAEALAQLSPADKDAIAAAINTVPGVNTTAVLAAVHFNPPGITAGPQLARTSNSLFRGLPQEEPVPSRN